MESTWTGSAPTLDRLDRRVGRCVVQASGDVLKHRIAYTLEQALRLIQLPGESEGRVYCFRRAALRGVSSRADLKDWIDRAQRDLGALAAKAVRGATGAAATAEAVYFDNMQHALETLLRRAIRSAGPAPWYSSSILGVPPAASRTAEMRAIVERLRQPPIPPAAAPRILLDAIGDGDPVPLLAAVSSETTRSWMREWDALARGYDRASPVELGEGLQAAVHRAALHFGWRDERVMWLCGMAVLAAAPSSLISGTVMSRARAVLHKLEDAGRISQRWSTEPQPHGLETESAAFRNRLVFDEDRKPDAERAEETERTETTLRAGSTDAMRRATDKFYATEGEINARAQDSGHDGATVSEFFGEPSEAAGLFFLLPVLRHLGIAAAVESFPELQEAGFAEHILRLVAKQCHVASGDPALACLHTAGEGFTIPEAMRRERDLLTPANLRTPRKAPDGATLLRWWKFAIRLWCWRAGRLPLMQIVHRTGQIFDTPGELDISFPLAQADVRIRRLGLDIDPGLTPWFGVVGTTVRFHYRDRIPEGWAE